MRYVVVGTVALFALVPLVTFAATFRAGDTIDLRAGETINDDVYATGGTVSSAGVINGDLYAGGGTILVTGSVSADAVMGGGTITVTGSIGDDLRAGGGTIVIQGSVGGDVVAGGGQIHLSGSRIGGDVLAGGGIIRIDAPVGQDIKVGGGDVYINAPVAGNVEVEAEKLTLGPRAVISGNLTYKSPKEAVVEPGARVVGTTTYTPRADRGTIGAAFVSIAVLVKLLMALVGGLFFGLVFNRYSTHLIHSAFAKPLLEIGRGFVALIVMPVASVLLLVSVIGIPLGVLGLIGFVGAVLFSWLVAPVLLGSFIYRWIKKGDYVVNWKTILLGVFAFFVLGLVPVLGSLVQCVFIILTFGALLKLKWQLIKEWR